MFPCFPITMPTSPSATFRLSIIESPLDRLGDADFIRIVNNRFYHIAKQSVNIYHLVTCLFADNAALYKKGTNGISGLRTVSDPFLNFFGIKLDLNESSLDLVSLLLR